MSLKKMNVDAVIFDLDGTILDSIGIYYQIIEIVFQHLDMPMPSEDKLREAAKTGDFEWDEVLPDRTRQEKDRLIKKAGAVVAEIYPKMFEKKVQLTPRAKETLEHISQKGIKMGLVTSTPRQNLIFKRHPLANAGIEELLEVVIAADDVPRKKPAADPLLECSRRLGIRAEDSVYVGDSRTDVQAGIAAGMKTVAVLTGFDLKDALKRENPDAVIDSIADLKGILA